MSRYASTSLAEETSQPSSLQMEAKALLDNEWWISYTIDYLISWNKGLGLKLAVCIFVIQALISNIALTCKMGQFALYKFLLTIFLLFSISKSLPTGNERSTYIIHMDKSAMPAPFSTHHDWYTSTLSSLSSPDGISPVHLYSYKHVMDGFSAVLSQTHLNQLEKLPGHVSTFPESYGHLHTTHTPKFLGLNKHSGLWPEGKFGDDIIIGVLDTGIWPESESFNDRNMPPVPQRWQGMCETGTEFNTSHCNKKLIGARKFSQGMKQVQAEYSNTNDYDSPGISGVMEPTHHQLQLGAECKMLTTLVTLKAQQPEWHHQPESNSHRSICSLEERDICYMFCRKFRPSWIHHAQWSSLAHNSCAGTVDRELGARVTLGDGILLSLEYLYSKDVAGKFVFCDYDNESSVFRSEDIYGTDIAGAIFSSDDGEFQEPAEFYLPFVTVNANDGDLIKTYILNTTNATVSVRFAGVAALLKATHREWSSAAIRSAMMTTADVTDNANGRIIDMTTAVAGTLLILEQGT
ncbi:hypothetical protein GH714_034028 [Hevea brasiliensis]|uniref:Inhibitor I9 domain-containing protein n=1 Tax=Hevea brasiliensis TaxID=3981 RepID=A0A6A6N4K0_HEVBR|nr:hypothetical protein GH714_034028 [Hevea brasiliensis]